ncbi:hypothetical protein K1T71_004349 [Dendrolimus kikuchii]|uniref:Uncharacterized protein n=1 Tax=Dendrolimus kikuchii TaxID=765133 RepID=A0ACC1D829_9NEOP|nr:hypothetical protein K1T71_004349 [Dendrolimus kikuchii]
MTRNTTIFNLLIFLTFIIVSISSECTIPIVLRNTWFSFENGQQTITDINASEMTGRGLCVNIKADFRVNYTMVFQHESCYYCVKLIVRTVNVLEKIETPCVNVGKDEEPTVERVCRDLKPDQNLVTLFSENYVPVNCRSSLEGVWQFAYQNRFRFTGECNHPNNQIRSCQTAGTQFLITNQKFNITYRKCPGMSNTFDGVVEYSCLGHWFVDKNHFFAVANTKESRKDEKYRCFLKNRDDDLYIGASITPECNTLKTVEKSPERYRVTPVKAEVVEPGCRLPQNFSGDWINTANIDADVFINETHIIETYYPDEGRYRRTIYVCREQRDSRVMMARLTVDGCQKDYICFEFVPRHHNIKENYCLTVDHLGRPVDIYSDPDYKMKCIGFWKENLKSYLITYDELDPFSKYRCWVYQRADLNRILMSQALGPYCDLKQDVTSWNYTEGAAVAVEMEEYERERDQCPMHFDDGSDPWSTKESYIKVLTFSLWGSNSGTLPSVSLSTCLTIVIATLLQ